MATTVKRRTGRPKTSVLSIERIAEAALRLIDAAGFDAMTMKALAAELGVAPSALYNHVPSKAALWLPVQERLMGDVDVSVFQRLPLPSAMSAWARSYRDVFAAHPGAITGIAVLPVAGSPRTLGVYEAVASALSSAGLPDARIVSVIVAFESFIFGSALDVTAPEDIFDAGAEGEEHPIFSRAVTARAALPAAPADDAFEQGLAALLALLPTR
ncbi:MAG: TetR/AcrR family transcriptional regulator [Arthrobacter sp.]|nr:TetR/AcrR family transcriptional regulator [Arthrobacter sp.]